LLPGLTNGISKAVTDSLNPHLTKTNTIMEQVSKNTMEAQGETLNAMVDHFVNSLNEVTGNHLENLGEALNDTVQCQEKVQKEMSELVAELSSAAKQQANMAQSTIDLTSKLNEHTINLADFEDKLLTSTLKLNELTETNTTILKQMSDSLLSLDDTVEYISSLGRTISSLQQDTESTTNTLNIATKDIIKYINSNKKLNEALISQYKVSNEWNTKAHQSLEDITYNFKLSQVVQDNLNELYKVIKDERKSLDAQQSKYNEVITNGSQQLI